MEEKVLIKSERYNVKKFFIIMVIIGAVLSTVMFSWYMFDEMDSYDYYYESYLSHQEYDNCDPYGFGKCYGCEKIENNPTKFGFALAEVFDYYFIFCLIPITALALIGGLIYLGLRSYELTVTDKRIYGKIAWGKRVDLPVDSVSATATLGSKGISVSTSSGRIRFRTIKNANEIYEVVNNLLIERQQKRNNTTVIAPVSNTTDEADQLKKYKDLLDSGVITQEEFDAKKKQLLGL